MNAKNFELAKQYALRRLEQELSPNLSYHRLGHTRDEVVPAAERLAVMEGLKREAKYLLLTAAWFHDLGYAENLIYHELISVRIAAEVLPGFGYTAKEIDVVRWAILATILPQKPTTLLEQVLTDADLDNLGREEFMTRNNDLRREFAFFGKKYTEVEWYENQVGFLERHKYFTPSARKLRGAGKRANIALLKHTLQKLERGS